MHLRPSVWEQGGENYKNAELKVKLWEEVLYRMYLSISLNLINSVMC